MDVAAVVVGVRLVDFENDAFALRVGGHAIGRRELGETRQERGAARGGVVDEQPTRLREVFRKRKAEQPSLGRLLDAGGEIEEHRGTRVGPVLERVDDPRLGEHIPPAVEHLHQADRVLDGHVLKRRHPLHPTALQRPRRCLAAGGHREIVILVGRDPLAACGQHRGQRQHHPALALPIHRSLQSKCRIVAGPPDGDGWRTDDTRALFTSQYWAQRSPYRRPPPSPSVVRRTIERALRGVEERQAGPTLKRNEVGRSRAAEYGGRPASAVVGQRASGRVWIGAEPWNAKASVGERRARSAALSWMSTRLRPVWTTRRRWGRSGTTSGWGTRRIWTVRRRSL